MKTIRNPMVWWAVVALVGSAVSLSQVQAADAPAKDVPNKAEPAKENPPKAAPAKETPAKDAPAKEGPVKVPAAKPVPPTPPKPKLPPIAKWTRPAVADVRAKVFAWLDQRKVTDAVKAKANQIWSFDPQQASGTDLLVYTVATFGLADEAAQKLVDLCSRPRVDLVVPSQPWLTDPKSDPLVANNLRLLFGRWLAHENLYDEALEQLAPLNPGDVVDPASLLFYQAVVYHRLLDKDAGLRAADGLMKSEDQCPRRYVVVAGLMREDLANLKDDSLDHIARRMWDTERRLDLGRAGPKVRTIEDGIIDSLDKLIKKLEDQQGGGGGGGASGSNIRSSSPAPDSRIIGGKGPGEVTKRDIGSASGWGNLPPKKRDEALQQIGRDFPSHYRDKIEAYFRKLANENSSAPRD
jgi:hypothetical protein